MNDLNASLSKLGTKNFLDISLNKLTSNSNRDSQHKKVYSSNTLDDTDNICAEMEELTNAGQNLFYIFFSAKNGWIGDLKNYFSQCETNESILREESVNGQNILHYAAQSANPEMIKLLKEKMSKDTFTQLINKMDNKGNTPIFQILVHRQYNTYKIQDMQNAIELLQNNGADIYHKNYRGRNLLHFLAENDVPDLASWLVNEKKFFINEKDNEDSTPLIIAAKYRCQARLILELINLGANWAESNKYDNSLITEIFAMGGDNAISLLEKLASDLSDVNDYLTENFNKAFYKAAENDHFLLLAWLKTFHGNKVNINFRDDSSGKTPLYAAAERGAPNAVDWLLENGADPSIRVNNDFNAYGIALDRGFKQIAERIKSAMIRKKNHNSIKSRSEFSMETPHGLEENGIKNITAPSKSDEKLLTEIKAQNDQGYNRARFYIQYKKANFDLLSVEEKENLIEYARRSDKTDFLKFISRKYNATIDTQPNIFSTKPGFNTSQIPLSKENRRMLSVIGAKNHSGYNQAVFYIQYKKANFSLLSTEEQEEITDYASQNNRVDFLAFMQKNYPDNANTSQTPLSKEDRKMFSVIEAKNHSGYNQAVYYIQYKKANFNLLNAEEKKDLIEYTQRTNKTNFLGFIQKNYPDTNTSASQILNFNRSKREVIPNDLVNTYFYPNWISNFYNWASNFLSEKTSRDVKESPTKPTEFSDRCISSLDFNGLLQLLDLFIRRYNGRKHSSHEQVASFSQNDALAGAMQIVEQFEEAIKKSTHKSGLSYPKIKEGLDYPRLQRQITEALHRDAQVDVQRILYQEICSITTTLEQTQCTPKQIQHFEKLLEEQLQSQLRPSLVREYSDNKAAHQIAAANLASYSPQLYFLKNYGDKLSIETQQKPNAIMKH